MPFSTWSWKRRFFAAVGGFFVLSSLLYILAGWSPWIGVPEARAMAIAALHLVGIVAFVFAFFIDHIWMPSTTWAMRKLVMNKLVEEQTGEKVDWSHIASYIRTATRY